MENSLSKCVMAAKAAGVPKDQAQQLLEHAYIPLPWQWQFHAVARQSDKDNGPVDVGVGGARGPGKSHAVMSQAGLDDCQRFPGIKGLFLRQTGVAAKESFDDLIDKTLRSRTKFNTSGNKLVFDNNSKIILGGFKDQNDIDKYIGIEYDFMIVEELNQLTEDKYIRLRGSLRTSKDGWRPRMYTSSNPGGIGHQFVKQRYIIPHRENKETETRFIGSTYKSNPYLNKEYIEYLESLTGDLGKAWREGNWDLFAGTAFSELNADVHVVEPFELHPQTKYFAGYDWGYSHPFGFTLWGIQPDGSIYNTAFCTGNKEEIPQHADKIRKLVGDMRINVYAGTDCWAHRGGPMIVDQLKKELPNLTFLQAYTDRVNGVAKCRELISYRFTKSGQPRLRFFKNCQPVFDNWLEMQYDEKHPEDVLKMDANENGIGGDDLYECSRYATVTYLRPPEALQQKNTKDELLDWIDAREQLRNSMED